MSMRRDVEYVRRNAFQDKTKNYATHCRCLYAKGRDSAVAEASFLAKEFMRRSTKKVFIRRFLAASRMMKCFMQASYKKNGANI